jgi:hypothetical protein
MNVALLLPLLGLLGPQQADQSSQAYLAIYAETTAMRMAGMKMPQLPPGIDLSKIPGGQNLAAMFGGRKLTVRLWSPSIAPADATASIAPPAGLKQGSKLDLDLYRPEAGQTSDTSGDTNFDTSKMKDYTIKIYWGSSPTVKPGQPKIIKFGDLTPAQIDEMRKRAAEMRRQSSTSYFYKPDWTTAYWPSKNQPGQIAKDASLVGTYALTTNYCGNVNIDAPSNVDFLAPIEITQPSLDTKLDLTGALAFQWQPIPNLLGSYAMITAMEGQDTIILWYSSEVYDQASMGLNWGYLEMAQVKDLVQKTVMMPGDSTSVTVPAGIFANADFASMMMVGFGPGSALDQGQPLPRIQTKTSLMLMLGGKKMRGIGGPPN